MKTDICAVRKLYYAVCKKGENLSLAFRFVCGTCPRTPGPQINKNGRQADGEDQEKNAETNIRAVRNFLARYM